MIRQTRDGAILTVTIDRPDKAGALTRDMLQDMADAIEAAADAKLLVITGTGKAFSAGADLEAARAGLATDPVWERLSGTVAGFPGLSIAALNGTVAGGAMGMVLACDLRVGVAQAKFFYPVMKLGFLPQPSDPGRLRALVGPARAKLVLMAGQKLTADQALAWGLLDAVIDDPDTLLAYATGLGQDVLTAEPAHIAAIKAMIAAEKTRDEWNPKR